MSKKDYIPTVEKLYVSYLGRPADPVGLKYWSEVVEKYGIDAAIDGFANSLEAQSIYFFDDPEEVIIEAYENLFDRYPYYYEISYWESVCQDPKELVWEIANSAQGFDQYVLEHKIKAATDFTSSIDSDLDGFPPFCAEYSGDIDMLLGKEFLSEVTEKGESIISDFIEKMKDYSTLSDSLILGFHWNKNEITYSFSQDEKALSLGYKLLSENERLYVKEALDEISEIIPITFRETDQNPDVRFFISKNLSGDAKGEAVFDKDTVYVLFNPVIYESPGYFFETPYGRTGLGEITIYHEIGHVLGLKHPFEGYPILFDEFDKTPFTVMSYNIKEIYTVEFSKEGNELLAQALPNATPFGFSLLDVIALQRLYGVKQTNTEDNIYKFDDDFIGYKVIHDTGGDDTIDCSQVSGTCIIDIRPGAVSSINLKSIEDIVYENTIGTFASYYNSISDFVGNLEKDDMLYTGKDNLALTPQTIIENVTTGDGADVVFDNSADNIIKTGAGNDLINLGEGGDDFVDGGPGYDTVFLPFLKDQFSISSQQLDSSDLNIHIELAGVEKIEFLDTVLLLA